MKAVYIALGAVSLALGVLGIFLPVLPTTPFLLLTAAAWCKASPRLYGWLLANRVTGTYIRNWHEHRAIPRRAKIVSVAMLWATISASAIFMVDEWWLRGLLVAVAVGVSIHILSFKTLPRDSR